MANFNWPSITTSSAPIQYNLNGSPTTVSQDTGTPANSKPLPVTVLNSSGTLTDFATATKQDLQITQETLSNTKLDSLIAKDFATSAKQDAQTTVLGTLALETTQAAMSAKLPATIGQKTAAASLGVVLASDQSALPIRPSVVSTVNSSATPLAANGVFTGTGEDILNYSYITITAFSNVASAALGLSVQQSTDNTNWDLLDTYTVPAGVGKTFSFAANCRYFRLLYTNGATLQTTFRLQTVFHNVAVRASTHSLAEVMTDQNDAELVIAQMRAMVGTVPTAITATGTAMNINTTSINGVAVSMGTGVSGTGVQRVVLASDSPAQPPPAAVTVKNAAITVGTTAVRLTTDALAPSATRRTLQFMADPASGANFWYGASTVTASGATRGIPLFPGQNTQFMNDVNDYYVISDTAAQTVFIVEAE